MTGTLPAVIDRASDPVVERFLDLVASTGNSTAAARAVGLHRNSFYALASRDDAFRARWDEAQVLSRRHQAQEVMEKAMVATGRIVEEPVLDPVTGEPLLDENLERVVVRRLVDADARILSKLLDKLVASEDGPARVQVNNIVPAAPQPLRAPRLVLDEVSPSDAQQGAAEEPIEASWEPLG